MKSKQLECGKIGSSAGEKRKEEKGLNLKAQENKEISTGDFFSYNAQPPYKIRHQIKFWVPQLLGRKRDLLSCPRPILGWMSPI